MNGNGGRIRGSSGWILAACWCCAGQGWMRRGSGSVWRCEWEGWPNGGSTLGAAALNAAAEKNDEECIRKKKIPTPLPLKPSIVLIALAHKFVAVIALAHGFVAAVAVLRGMFATPSKHTGTVASSGGNQERGEGLLRDLAAFKTIKPGEKGSIECAFRCVLVGSQLDCRQAELLSSQFEIGNTDREEETTQSNQETRDVEVDDSRAGRRGRQTWRNRGMRKHGTREELELDNNSRTEKFRTKLDQIQLFGDPNHNPTKPEKALKNRGSLMSERSMGHDWARWGAGYWSAAGTSSGFGICHRIERKMKQLAAFCPYMWFRGLSRTACVDCKGETCLRELSAYLSRNITMLLIRLESYGAGESSLDISAALPVNMSLANLSGYSFLWTLFKDQLGRRAWYGTHGCRPVYSGRVRRAGVIGILVCIAGLGRVLSTPSS
ncbi:hypothetical protein B0H19DRAFT_1085102 [Mycena capillaripes]|nr:hypothetical protein B0H19DRAFT_1085102 [Mycena capillaripes]